MREDPNLPLEPQSALFSATTLFERVIWLARRNALLLALDTEATSAAQAEAA